MDRVALIDADSIVYTVAWNHIDSEPPYIHQACESIVNSILTRTSADYYLGAFSSTTNFRDTIYKYAKYKGNRPEKPEWLLKNSKLIKEYLVELFGFNTVDNLEADDVIAGVGNLLTNYDVIYCSPDKDFKQLVGMHYDFSKVDNDIKVITESEAKYYFDLQMLIGDVADNVKSLPGIGIKKAIDFLKPGTNSILEAYLKQYGEYYGPIIHKETFDTLSLITPSHTYWETYREKIMYVSTLLHKRETLEDLDNL